MKPIDNKIFPIEKIISVLSYLSMGVLGIIWVIFAYICKRNLKYFLMYNIVQSMLISIILAVFYFSLGIILSILAIIPVLNVIAAVFNYIISVKIIRLYQIGVSFTLLELIVFILLAYIICGIIAGKIFYVPVLTNLMNKVMNRYK